MSDYSEHLISKAGGDGEPDESICGLTYDHDERITYKDADTEQWECAKCGAEWWQDPDPEPNAYQRADDALTKAIEDAVNGRGTWEHVQTARHALNQTRRA